MGLKRFGKLKMLIVSEGVTDDTAFRDATLMFGYVWIVVVLVWIGLNWVGYGKVWKGLERFV